MQYIPGENIFEKFFAQRESLIFQYKKGDLNKREYIEESHAYLVNQDVKPFKNVDAFEKAVFNYQYYNIMAKYFHMKSETLKTSAKHPELAKQYSEKRDKHYHLKDKMTLRAVELKDYYDLEAYYIKVSSVQLKKVLYEIIFHEHPDVVFHSKSRWLRERLEREGVFSNTTKRSVIEQYVNEKY
ncbi:hypothetical protein SAMN05192551_101565 [Tindallia magadiensis]|uniref:Uncharacterized protein n=1 Tax=Tindallia magadiensis TaxID=69895 RepID=A0A1I3B3P0_9FIRM|nr:DUF6648 family protein [Tindallia magadiensis]SFH56904.1 hypothetical protein SAMN05192551_101565 [Tindallia magadiensis]